ncbi:armadillo-like helical domain containing protein 1 isoform X2 [Rhincodon typus]|uniref:armadillo-like helical domain containing protein 1 isoform X2 n=1 Tax=Rhincodon typus TaxID=259920 RepID=UPI002030D9FE|nr:armadillo-like helical domain containing protein 1 isoform X2 [Rhincodon typus]
MASSKEEVEISGLMSFLQEWDNGTKAVRHRMLNDFINTNKGKTGPELELQFAQGASLFLTRLTAWLRLTYMVGTCVTEQLQAIGVFLSATSVRNVAECLANAKLEKTLEQAQILLELLAQGNPKYQLQVYKGLIALLPCTSPKVQQLALQTLMTLQTAVKIVHPCIVEPLLNVLKTIHYEVQYEGIEFIKVLLKYNVRKALLEGLVARLNPSVDNIQNRPKILDDEPTLPLFVQQTAAAKAIGLLIQESAEIAEELLQLRVVHHLMIAMGNLNHADSQRQASLTLEHLVRTFPVVEENVRKAMGETLFELYMTDPGSFYLKMDSIQAAVLVGNKINIPGIEEGPE